MILSGAVLGIAGLPIVLAGIAELLVSELGMRRGFAWLGVGVVVLAIVRSRIAQFAAPPGFAVRSWGSR